jgi:hypothetical protein
VRLLQWLGFEGVVMEAVEIAMKTEVVLGPNALERLDEFFRATIALIEVQPRLANGPTRYSPRPDRW